MFWAQDSAYLADSFGMRDALSRAATTTTTPPTVTNDIAHFRNGYELSLRARNRAPKTITGYLQTVELFRLFLLLVGMPTRVDQINREHVEAFIAEQVDRWKPKTAHVRYGDLRQFFNWLLEEREISHHPMSRMNPPRCSKSRFAWSQTPTSSNSSRSARVQILRRDGTPPLSTPSSIAVFALES